VNWANAIRVIDIKKSSLSSKQEPGYETVARVDRKFNEDVATKANEDISAEGNMFIPSTDKNFTRYADQIGKIA
jgi:hypothetical protein